MSLKTKLNLFDFTMIMVSFVIGMGIFRTPVNVAKAVPDTQLFFLTWIAGGVVALCGALTYAEIGSRYPITGGYYRIFSVAYHPSVAFAINGIILISNAASLAGVSLIGAEYISAVLWPGQTDLQTARLLIAIASILIFYAVNLLGLKMSARTQNILTVIKIGLILLLITPLFLHTATPAPLTETATCHSWKSYIKAFGIGLVAVSFTYGGYQQSINFGEEVERPGKTIPRGIFLGIGIILLLYLSINYAYIKVIGFTALKQSEGIAATMATLVLGDSAGKILSVLLFLSVLAYVNVLLMSNPRVMQAMSEDGVLPRAFAQRTAKRDVLFTSLSVFAALCALIVFWAKTFDEILSFSIFLDSFGMVLSAATIFTLRKQTAHLNNSGIYQMKFFPMMPLVFMAAYALVAVSIFFDKPQTALIGLLMLALFMGLYFILNRKPNHSAPPNH